MRRVLLFGFALAALAAAQTGQTFRGTVTDSECPNANHSLMKMGDDDAECALACVDSHGATYLLYDGKVSYALSDQKAPAAYAGKKVVVTGTLDAKTKTLHVESISPAK